MSQLKENIHKNDYLMDKVTKDLYFVVTISLHNVLLRKEIEGDEPTVKRMPKHLVNASLIKVKPDVARVLYEENIKKNNTNSISNNA